MKFENIYSTDLVVNIYDINYGGHLAHDRLLSMMHEARIRFFESIGQSEVDFYGTGLIVKSVHVDYRKEVYRGDRLQFLLSVIDIKGVTFSISYKVLDQSEDTVADATLEIVTFDYSQRKIAKLSHEFIKRLEQIPI